MKCIRTKGLIAFWVFFVQINNKSEHGFYCQNAIFYSLNHIIFIASQFTGKIICMFREHLYLFWNTWYSNV